LIIAIDYDDTYTADRALFAEIIRTIKAAGHEAYFVTYRRDRTDGRNSDIHHSARALDIPIVYTAEQQKKDVFKADIWIDDKPELIPTVQSLVDEFAFRKPRRRY